MFGTHREQYRIFLPPMPTDASAAVSQPQAPVPLRETGLLDSSYEVEVQLAEQEDDAGDTIYSATTFDQLKLDMNILRGLWAENFRKLSKIQERALPLLLRTNPTCNVIVQSQSGSGKTAAFVITILSHVDHDKPTTPQALVLAPTRELVRQIADVIKTIGRFIVPLKTELAVPGIVDRRETGVKASVVVGTPGKVLDLVRRRQLNMSKVKLLVVDEADNMLDAQGLGDQCLRVKK